MFTVVICDKQIISDCRDKYNIYTKPLLNDKNMAFCPWNTSADSLEEALPTLRSLIKGKSEWQVLIVNDSSTWDFETVYKLNPYDYVDSKKIPTELSTIEDVMSFREYNEKVFDKALTNPLSKLSIWLCGSPLKSSPSMEQYLDVPATVDATYFNALKKISVSPIEYEIDLSRANAFEKLNKKFIKDGELFNPPQRVLSIALRLKNVEVEKAEVAWKAFEEFEYSKFYMDNLYSEKLRYLIFDAACKHGVINESEYFNFLILLLVLAGHTFSGSILNPYRVYNIKINIDEKKIRNLCNAYRDKLISTIKYIDVLSDKHKEDLTQPVEKDVAINMFESNITIPVNIDSHYDTDELFAKYNKIGFATDCPQNELIYWNEQYRQINKTFLRYLREPRRAIKSATVNDFHKNAQIVDERALRLNEYQIEDVEYKLIEEEYEMVTTATTQLFNTFEYSKRMKEADSEIRENMSKRMTKKKIIYVGLIAFASNLIGFIPQFINNAGSSKQLLVSFGVAAGLILLLAIIGMVYIYIKKRTLINRFKHFNYEMSGILDEIKNGLTSFSKYL